MNGLPAYRNLIFDFSRREIEKKYRGSYLGTFWAVLSPFLVLATYVFVYSYVFKVRVGDLDRIDFVIWLYAGLAVFFFFSEIVTTAPACIRTVPNFVKRVIFPLEVLVVARLLAALFSFSVNFILLLILILLKYQSLHWTLLLVPIIFLPTIIFSYGLALVFY
jgi:lipopolysaccharide transport system permease protein